MSAFNYDRNDAAVGDSVASVRCDYSGLTTTSSFRTTGSPNGGGTASATAGSEYGEVDTSNVVSHYIPAKANYKIVVWRVVGAASGTGATTTVSFESPATPGGSTFYEVGRIAATVATTSAFELPLVGSAQPSHKNLPLAVGFPGGCVKVKLAGTSISAVPVTVTYSYVREPVSNIG